MIPDLKGKVVLITGASTGIGAAAARAFAQAGCAVAVHYNASREQAEQVAADVKTAGARVALVGGDVTVEADVKRIVAETLAAFGRIDILINNAGGMLGRVKIEDYTVDPPMAYWQIGEYLTHAETHEEVEAGVFIRFFHRPLSLYINAAIGVGLNLAEMLEPAPPPGFLERAPGYMHGAAIPRLLALRFVLGTGE